MTKFDDLMVFPPEVPGWQRKADAMCNCLVRANFLNCEDCENTGWTPCPFGELL
jgi:hypothetical protein